MKKIVKIFGLVPVLCLCLFICGLEARMVSEGLDVGFYRRSCPKAEMIIRDVVSSAVSQNRGIAAGLIRLHFHDCFVNGCDASILLDETLGGGPVEKQSPANVGLRGQEVIDEAKMLLEEACPNTVSCADIIAYAARDAAELSGIPEYRVYGGRRDGRVSRLEDILGNIPFPDSDVETMTKIFKEKELSQEDLVVLLGAHSIGVIHCLVISDELYNKSLLASASDMDLFYAEKLRRQCPAELVQQQLPGWDQAVANLSPGSGDNLDHMFYYHLLSRRVTLQSDHALVKDPWTLKLVRKYARDAKSWMSRFQKAMIKMGRIDVLVKDEGEIRRSCRVVN